ncbi:MAG: ABC transporter ATP-binding protein, partial [Victivallales bacterium]|nr:ABC transporter ATP-binding protein [Victivallales bacterium]
MASLLEIKDLTVEFQTEDGILRAVDGVSLSLDAGETLGLVGESGCGKSVTSMSIPRLVPSPPSRVVSGEILFQGQDLLRLPLRELHRIRGQEIGVIFQEPMTALSPLRHVGDQIAETVLLHTARTRRQALALAGDWLAKVGIPDPGRTMACYPFELSGGMRQRVMIAMALVLEPRLIIADEPTTA